MARHESDREDILREATALVVRAELSVPEESDPVVVGFRENGAASVYFGGDPVYHFNAAGELRRAYVGGLLYKAERGVLVELKRQRSDDAVVLLSRELSPEECAAFLRQVRQRVAQLESGTAEIRRQVPAESDVSNQICDWIAQLPGSLKAASSPRVG